MRITYLMFVEWGASHGDRGESRVRRSRPRRGCAARGKIQSFPLTPGNASQWKRVDLLDPTPHSRRNCSDKALISVGRGDISCWHIASYHKNLLMIKFRKKIQPDKQIGLAVAPFNPPGNPHPENRPPTRLPASLYSAR